MIRLESISGESSGKRVRFLFLFKDYRLKDRPALHINIGRTNGQCLSLKSLIGSTRTAQTVSVADLKDCGRHLK